jgi:hypothetical protein
MTAFKLQEQIPTEGDEAECLMQWAQMRRHLGRKVSDYLIMIPNGAVLAGDARERAIAMARMKRQGFRPGVFDYILAIPVEPYPGLWIELKRQKLGVVSDEQKRFELAMSVMGWATAIAKGWDEARAVIEKYLKGSFDG